MSLIEQGKVIIEVGLNESATKQQNPNIPYGVAEVVEAGIRCAEAGATILHFHARDDDGQQLWTSAEVYRAEMEGIGARADVLMYPSYNGDFGHIWDLLADPPRHAPMFMCPFDVFQGVGLVGWDAAARQFHEVASDIDALGKSRGSRPAELDRMVELGQVPTICAQSLRDLRWTALALEAGMIQAPVSVKAFLVDGLVIGADPSPAGIDALLTHVTDEMEMMIVPARMSTRERTEVLLRHALARGTHIRVGLGDNPGAFATESNADLVRWAIDLVREAGFEPATADDVRTYFATHDDRAVGTIP